MNRVCDYFGKFVWITFAVVLTIIALTASITFVEHYQHHGIRFFVEIICVVLIILLIAKLLLLRLYQRFLLLASKRPVVVLLAVCFISVVCRLIWLYLFQIYQFEGDYQTYHERAVSYALGLFPYDHYAALFPHVFGYSIILGFVYWLFGASAVVAQCFNVFLSLTAILILWFLFPVRSHPGSFLISALFLGLWPSLVYFSSAPNTEYLFIVMWLGTLLILKHSFHKSLLPTAGMLVIMVTVISLSNFVRSLGIILLIVLLLTMLFRIQPVISRNKLAWAVLAIAVFISQSALLNRVTSEMIQLQAAKSPIGFSVFVGTNPNKLDDRVGFWNMEDSQEMGMIFHREADAQRTHDIVLGKGIERLRQTFENQQLLTFIHLKIKTAWSSDSWSLEIMDYHLKSSYKSVASVELFVRFYDRLVAFGDFLYCVFLILSAVVVIRQLKSGRSFQQSTVSFACALFMIGNFLMLIVVEAAPRYHLPGLLAMLLVVAGIYSGSFSHSRDAGIIVTGLADSDSRQTLA